MGDKIVVYRRKRDRIVEGLSDLYELVAPRGAFYAFPKAPWGTGTEFVEAAIANTIDFGLLVDGSVVMIDNILRRVGQLNTSDPQARLASVEAAAREVLRPVTIAIGIIILVYVPILIK